MPDQTVGILHELRARLQLVRVARVARHEIVKRNEALGVRVGVIRQQLPHAELIDGRFQILKIGYRHHRQWHDALAGRHAAKQGAEFGVEKGAVAGALRRVSCTSRTG
jgi:hypothetical protein